MNLFERLKARTDYPTTSDGGTLGINLQGIVRHLCKVIAVERKKRRRAEERLVELDSRFQTLREEFDGLMQQRPWKEWRA